METNDATLGLLSRLLGAAEMRARVHSANIANQNTPGYTRRTVRFEELLKEALGGASADLTSIEPEVVVDDASPARPDGNNVSLEAEMTALRENRLLYETYAAMLAGHFELMRAAVSEGR